MKYYFYSYWWHYSATDHYEVYSTVCAGIHPFQDIANYYDTESKETAEMISFQEISKEDFDLYESLNDWK